MNCLQSCDKTRSRWKIEIENHRRSRINSSRCFKEETKENVVKNNIQIRLDIKTNTLWVGYKMLTQNPRTWAREPIQGLQEGDDDLGKNSERSSEKPLDRRSDRGASEENWRLVLGSLWWRVKGPCLVLVIEWQLRWTNSVYMRYTGD